MSSVTSLNLPNPVDPLPSPTKKNLGILFLTLFLDLISFSIIFPIFPALLSHYLAKNSQDWMLNKMLQLVDGIAHMSGNPSQISTVVLFGGMLVAVFSFMQFVFAPLWGRLSDRVGRKPVLILTISGITLSYLVWIFAGNFSLLLLSRMLGGVMAGNISTASAVVSDITTDETRSRGMAVIGMAFGLGFVIGPALGGFSSMVNPMPWFPGLNGINPFSFVAFLAFCLSSFNLLLVILLFKETWNPQGGAHHIQRKINPIKLFKPLPYVGANITNMSYFFFILAFSGMEFSLTFLATERLAYSSMDNALMFTFVGVLGALVQGGYVRRQANRVGERQMALRGLAILIPGLIVTGFSHSSGVLYSGLFLLALGSAMIIPCMTALVSLYTPRHEQGVSLGIFRSMGSLGRVVGPLLASLLYFRLGATIMYALAALLTFLPLILIAQLHKIPFASPKSPVAV